MAFTFSSKTEPSLSQSDKKMMNNNNKYLEQVEEREDNTSISSHLHLKPTHTSQTLNKDVILRRIRHRKRINKVRDALQTFLGRTADKASETEQDHMWLDDAFSAP